MSEWAVHRIHAAAAAAIMFLLLALCPSAVPADDPDATLGVVYADGRQTEDVPLYRLEKGSEELYISTYDVARIFKATKYWSPESRKLVLRIDSRRYLITIDTRVVVILSLIHISEPTRH